MFSGDILSSLRALMGDPTTSDMSFVVLKNGIDRDLLGEVGFAID